MDVEYLVGPEVTRLSRKCRRDRDHNYRSRTQYDRDVEEGKARIRALALMEEISVGGTAFYANAAGAWCISGSLLLEDLAARLLRPGGH